MNIQNSSLYLFFLAIVDPEDEIFTNTTLNISGCLKNKTVRKILAFTARLFFYIPYLIAKIYLHNNGSNKNKTPPLKVRTTHRKRLTPKKPPLHHPILKAIKEYQSGDFKSTGLWYPPISTCNQHIKDGKKQGHWIWYVFPQHHGISARIRIKSSTMNDKCCMRSLKDAKAFLDDKQLKSSYLESCSILLTALRTKKESTLNSIFRSDAIKVISSLTLFYKAAESASNHPKLRQIIDNIRHVSGFQWDKHTLALITSEEN